MVKESRGVRFHATEVKQQLIDKPKQPRTEQKPPTMLTGLVIETLVFARKFSNQNHDLKLENKIIYHIIAFFP